MVQSIKIRNDNELAAAQWKLCNSQAQTKPGRPFRVSRFYLTEDGLAKEICNLSYDELFETIKSCIIGRICVPHEFIFKFIEESRHVHPEFSQFSCRLVRDLYSLYDTHGNIVLDAITYIDGNATLNYARHVCNRRSQYGPPVPISEMLDTMVAASY